MYVLNMNQNSYGEYDNIKINIMHMLGIKIPLSGGWVWPSNILTYTSIIFSPASLFANLFFPTCAVYLVNTSSAVIQAMYSSNEYLKISYVTTYFYSNRTN